MESIKTERMILFLATDAEMEEKATNAPIPELQQAYREMLEKSRANARMRAFYALWLMRDKEAGTELGGLCFHGINKDGMVEIGYGMEPEYEGKGYMTEAVTALAEWAEGRAEVSCVEAEAEKDNAASIRVLEKVGFVPTGKMGEEGPRFVHKKKK